MPNQIDPDDQKIFAVKMGKIVGKIVRVENIVSFIILALALLVTAAFAFWPKATVSQKPVPRSQFAVCLATKQVTMYGSDSCESCVLQKGMFEEDFNIIHYINCDIDQEECSKNGIQKWPTWMYNGASVVGVQTFGELAKFSGCAGP